MDYQKMYQDKLVSADEAVKVVKSGDWVEYGWCVTAPQDLDEALAKRASELTDVKIRSGITSYMPKIMLPDDAGEHFMWNSWHWTGVDRMINKKHGAYFLPLRYVDIPWLYRHYIEDVDVFFLSVPPMDEFGNFSFSVSTSHMAAVAERAKKIVLEVNTNVPRVHATQEGEINIKDVDFVIESSNPPLVQLGSAAPTDVDKAVAELIVPEIPDGACLQLGIGGMPNTIGAMIVESDLKDLGVHTEMYVDSFVDMSEAGKITGKYKELDKGRQVFAFGAGTQKLYDYCNDNPDVMGAPVDYTNDVRIISQLSNFISINNVVDVDLFGQVNAETAGFNQISGTGGQLDFVLGATMSKGGKSFLCMSSAMKAKDGTLKSRVLPALTTGGVSTCPRSVIDYIATEYGMVNLKGCTTWQRAERLISIAHPDFRDELVAHAEKVGIWTKSNKK